jgi:hypothetical protein
MQQRGLTSGQHCLVDAQGTGERESTQLGDEVNSSKDDARLGSAQQLVTAARDNIGLASEALLDGWFVG